MIILAPDLAKDAAELAVGVGGVAGSIIGVLMGVIVVLSGVIVWMQKRADKVYGYRLSERDTLKDALHEAASSAIAQANATRERNVLLDELASTITEQSQAIAVLVERLSLQHGNLVNDHDRTAAVITSIADAMRNATLQTSGLQQKIDQLLMGAPGLTKEIREALERADRVLMELQREPRRSR